MSINREQVAKSNQNPIILNSDARFVKTINQNIFAVAPMLLYMYDKFRNLHKVCAQDNQRGK